MLILILGLVCSCVTQCVCMQGAEVHNEYRFGSAGRSGAAEGTPASAFIEGHSSRQYTDIILSTAMCVYYICLILLLAGRKARGLVISISRIASKVCHKQQFFTCF